jgi:hypothetical protein
MREGQPFDDVHDLVSEDDKAKWDTITRVQEISLLQQIRKPSPTNQKIQGERVAVASKYFIHGHSNSCKAFCHTVPNWKC